MGGAVKLRQDFGADELRRFAAKAKDVAQAVGCWRWRQFMTG